MTIGGAMPNDARRGPRKRTFVQASGVAAALGLAAIATYASRTESVAGVAAVGVMLAGAAAVSGVLLGFVFAIPRTAVADTRVDADIEPPRRTRFEGNTNLEQISDWLTKILVGAGLVQLGSIRSGLGDLVSAVSPALGGGPAAAAFAGALLVYFVVLGFLVGWLLTRLFLGEALAAADEEKAYDVLDQAAVAAQEGDTERSAELRAVARDYMATARAAAELYNALRATKPSGWGRTAELEAAVRAAQVNAQTMSAEGVRALYASGTEGDRVAALGAIAARADLGSADLVTRSVAEPGSGFEQYQALVAARAIAPHLSAAEDRRRLAAAVRAQCDGRIKPGTDRWQVAQEVLGILGEPLATAPAAEPLTAERPSTPDPAAESLTAERPLTPDPAEAEPLDPAD